ATPDRMQGASAFENPSTSLFLLSVINEVDHQNSLKSSVISYQFSVLGKDPWEPRTRLYFEYSSTMSCSLIGGVCTSSRFGRATPLALNCSRCCSSQGTAFWLCATLRASSTAVFWCIFSLMATSSPTVTRYDGMFTFFPFTRTWPCSTSCRACEREDASPARHTTLSRRRSSVMIRFSPVWPLERAAFSK